MINELFFNFVVLVGGGLITVLIGVIAYFLSRLVEQVDENTKTNISLKNSFESIATTFEGFQKVHDQNTKDIGVLKTDMVTVKQRLQL